MADKRSTISAQLRADATGWKRGCDVARAELKRLKKDVESTKIKGPQMEGGDGGGGGGKAMTGAIAKGNLLATLAEKAISKVVEYGEAGLEATVWLGDSVDSLKMMGLTAEEAKYKFEEILQIANKMAISDEGVKTLLDMQIQLQSMGYTAEESISMLREFANAAENMGVGIEALMPMMAAFDKINQNAEATKKNIAAITSNTKQLRPVMLAAFGTDVAADIEKMNLSAGELMQRLQIGLRTMPTAEPSKEELSQLYWSEGAKLQAMLAAGRGTGRLPELDPRKELTAKEAERSLVQAKDIGARKRLLEIEKEITDERRDQIEKIQQATEESKVAFNQAKSLLLSDKDISNERSEFLKKEEIIKSIGKDRLDLEQDIKDAIDEATLAMTENENAAKRMLALKDQAANREQRQINEMRQVGRDRKANQLEDAQKIKKLKAEGLTDEDARAFVDEERRAARNEALGPGRRLIGQKKKLYRPDVTYEPKGFKIPAPANFGNRAREQLAKEQIPTDNGITKETAHSMLQKLTQIEINTKPLPSNVQSGSKK